MSDPLYLFSSFLSSLVGYAVFRYGRKQSRPPHVIGGIVLMAISWFLPSAPWVILASLAIGGVIVLAIRLGY